MLVFIDDADVERVILAAKETGIPVSTAVIRLGLCGEEVAYEAMSHAIKWPLVRITRAVLIHQT